jgi:ubiquitin-conjugating enzyme E2 M
LERGTIYLIPLEYPSKAPRVRCLTRIFHPNIDLNGNIDLNLLQWDWKSTIELNSVIYGLLYLFYDPNFDDPLNNVASAIYKKDPSEVS